MRSIGFEPQPPHPKHQKQKRQKQTMFFSFLFSSSNRGKVLSFCGRFIGQVVYVYRQAKLRSFSLLLFLVSQHFPLLPLFHALNQPLERPNQPYQDRHHRRSLRERLGDVGLIKGLPDLDRAFANQARSCAHGKHRPQAIGAQKGHHGKPRIECQSRRQRRCAVP